MSLLPSCFCKRLIWLRTKYSSYNSFSQPQPPTQLSGVRLHYTNHSVGWCEPWVWAKGSFLIALISLFFALLLKRQCFSGSYHAPVARCVQYTTQEIGNVMIFALTHNVDLKLSDLWRELIEGEKILMLAPPLRSLLSKHTVYIHTKFKQVWTTSAKIRII